ncbi:molybdopterin-dependent oxidoreductase [Parafrankia sp. EUN1f]|uniref:molybdopterin-containing oxidoreductase family protein n=1 Tax=Parafrankia sp. EUN1f TaxID=102897 RepID=UPI0001C4471C|nr:molybdopterin-dependent oxidoreductase [Parafrankia sp. EUN1f]EFC83459.1 molybdopterin dinucleotide-binding region [Parafrankia sp. EUN1f]
MNPESSHLHGRTGTAAGLLDGQAGTVRTYCRLCEAGCGTVATVERGHLVRLRPDHDHAVTRGFACNKGLRAIDLHRDPDRLRVPLRREGDRFVPVSWDEAMEEIASRMRDAMSEHGPRAAGIYIGNPVAFNALGSAASGHFAGALGTDRVFSAATQDCSNKYAVAELLYGSPSANPIPDLRRTELLLVIGSNPRVSKSSFISVANPVVELRRIRDRGGRVVFVNPVDVEPDIGTTLQIRPDSDPYLLAAILHEIHRTVGFRTGAAQGAVTGAEQVAAFVAPYSPDAVADVVGLPAEVIAQLARDFATAGSAAIHVSTGLNMGRQGALAYWLVQMLLLLTGNLDRPGGNYFPARGIGARFGPVDRTAASFHTTRWGDFRRAMGLLPAALLPEFIGAADEPLRALVVVAGNPALSVGGGPELTQSLRSLDLLVTIDLYRNATGELADFVLPATDQFERPDLNTFVQGIQVEPYLQWTPAVVEADAQQREEWRILGQLLQAMGRTPLLDPAATDALPLLFDRALAPKGLDVPALRAAGGVVPLHEDGAERSRERLGVDGPLDCVPEALGSTLARGHALFEELRAEDPGRFKLVTRRTRDALNSAMGNLPTKRPGDWPNPLWMNPHDAADLGLTAGSRVSVSNEWGALAAEVQFDPRLRPGVVAMTHGFGNAGTTGMPVAQRRGGANVNVLTPRGPGAFDPVSCMSHITAIPVDVCAAPDVAPSPVH